MVQLTYNATPPIAFRGMLAEPFSLRQVDSFLAEGALNLGCAVEPGTDPAAQVVPLATLANFSGVTVGSSGIEKIAGSDAAYADKSVIPVMIKGRLWVIAGGTVAVGAEVIPSTGATTTFTAGNGTSSLVRAYARTAGVNTGLMMVELVPYTQPTA